MKKTFTNIEFNTKLHIAHYLTTHFGSPALIPHKHFINKFFKLSLKVRPNHNQKRINLYNTKVEICLYKDALFREGKELTLTSQMNLTNSIDCYIKDQIRLFVDNVLSSSKRNENWQKRFIELQKEHDVLIAIVNKSLDPSTIKNIKTFESRLKKRINEFSEYKFQVNDALKEVAYNSLGFNEQVLPLETLQKDYYRYKNPCNPLYIDK
jgi:hypothetical protein